MRIGDVTSRKILNSNGFYTLELSIKTSNGYFSSSTPKGTSKGKYEVVDFTGGLDAAIKNINKKIKPLLKRTKFEKLNDILDFESKTEQYGGNIVLSVSYALLKALAAEKNVPVWKLFTKTKKMPALLNLMAAGGKHAGKQSPTFQEFLVMQKLEHIEKNMKLHKTIGGEWGFWGKDLEGGWVLNTSHEKTLEIIRNYDKDSKIGIDVAASGFYDDGRYIYRNVSPMIENGKLVMLKSEMNSTEQFSHIKKLQERYNVYYIEDPLHEDDFRGFAELTKAIGDKALICGDDLFVTNPERLKKGINLGACNACIVKPDQIGSLKKTIEFVELAKKHKYTTIISHRSGETNENILADLAVGLQIPIMKIGICGGERVSKINRLFEIKGE